MKGPKVFIEAVTPRYRREEASRVLVGDGDDPYEATQGWGFCPMMLNLRLC